MKVEVNKKPAAKLSFPRLMRYSDENGELIIYAVGQSGPCLSGFIIQPNSIYKQGEYRTSWAADAFKDLEGSVTLEN